MLITELGLDDCCQCLGTRTHKEVLKQFEESDLLYWPVRLPGMVIVTVSRMCSWKVWPWEFPVFRPLFPQFPKFSSIIRAVSPLRHRILQ